MAALVVFGKPGPIGRWQLVLFKLETTTRQDVQLELLIRDTDARAVGSLDLDT